MTTGESHNRLRMECPKCGHATVKYDKEKGLFVCHERHCRCEFKEWPKVDFAVTVPSPAK